MQRNIVIVGILALSLSLMACGSTAEEPEYTRSELAAYNFNDAWENTGTGLDAIGIAMTENALDYQDEYKKWWKEVEGVNETFARFHNDVEFYLVDEFDLEDSSDATPAQREIATKATKDSYTAKLRKAVADAHTVAAQANPEERASRGATYWLKMAGQYKQAQAQFEQLSSDLEGGDMMERAMKVNALNKALSQMDAINKRIVAMKAYLERDTARVNEWLAGDKAFFDG